MFIKSKDHHSTRELLDLIRKDESDVLGSALPENALESDGSIPAAFKTRHLTIGVVITASSVTMALAVNGLDQTKHLIKWQKISLPPNLAPENAEFSELIKDSLDLFLEGRKKICIWCALDTEAVNVKSLLLPDLSESKMSNAAFWTFKKDTNFDEEKELFDFEIQQTLSDQGVTKRRVLGFSAGKKDAAAVQNAFASAGYPLSGITAIPFAVQNFFRTGTITTDDSHFAVVNVSDEKTDIFCFNASGLLLSRTLRFGSQNLLEEIDIPLDIDPVDYLCALKEDHSDESDHIAYSAGRLLNKVSHTGNYCAQTHMNNTPVSRYFVFGEPERCRLFLRQAKTSISANLRIFSPQKTKLPGTFEIKPPRSPRHRHSVLTALGTALSDNSITPNLMFPAKERDRIHKQKRSMTYTMMTGACIFAVCLAAHFMVIHTCEKHMEQIGAIQEKKAQEPWTIRKEHIREMIDIEEKIIEHRTAYLRDFRPLAAIFDICRTTRDPIRLTALTLKKSPDSSAAKKGTQMTLQGRVTGPTGLMNTALGQYAFNLSASPLFKGVEIKNKVFENRADETQLLFTVYLEVQ